MRILQRLITIMIAANSLAEAGCGAGATTEAEAVTGGRVNRGPALIAKYGCGACHSIPRIAGAAATVGPPLDRIAMRTYLGGHLTNTPGNLRRWIQDPQGKGPKNAMPDLGITAEDAKDIAAFVYTLR